MGRDWRRFNTTKFLKWLDTFFAGEPAYVALILGGEMGEITVKDDAPALLATATFLDSEGSQTTPSSPPMWSSSDESVATVEASEDGMSASIPIGSPGAAIISVTTTGADDAEVRAEGTITVQPGDAVIGSVEFSEQAAASEPPAEPGA